MKMALTLFALLWGTAGQAIAQGIFPPLQAWGFDPHQQILSITTHNLAQPKYFLLREPDRLVVDVLDTSWTEGTVRQSYGGNVSQIRIAQLSEGVTRFVLDWSGQPPHGQDIQWRSQPQGNGSILWQLSMGGNELHSTNVAPNAVNPTQNLPLTDHTSNPLAGRVVFDKTFPPALLPPVTDSTVFVAPPPNSDNVRK